jgi:hypothetical protein
VASTCSLMIRRFLTIVLQNVPLISGSNNPMTPRAWVSITSCRRVLAGATGAKVVRARSVNGPNRDTQRALGHLGATRQRCTADNHGPSRTILLPHTLVLAA